MPLIPKQEPPYYTLTDGPDPSGTKYYTAIVTQTGTNAPVATELINTIGGVIWTRQALGDYRLTLAGAFTEKTIIPPFYSAGVNLPIFVDDPTSHFYNMAKGGTDDYIYLATWDNTGAAVEMNTCLATVIVQIIIYP